MERGFLHQTPILKNCPPERNQVAAHAQKRATVPLIVVNMANVMAVAIVIVIRIVIVIMIVIVKVFDRVFAKTMKSPCKFNAFNAYL